MKSYFAVSFFLKTAKKMTIPIQYPPWFGAKLVGHMTPLTRLDRVFSSEYAPLRYNSIQLKTIGFF